MKEDENFDPNFDLSPLRIAMEHMIYRQEIELDHAALFFVLFSLGMVRDNLGEERMREILAQAITELEKGGVEDLTEH